MNALKQRVLGTRQRFEPPWRLLELATAGAVAFLVGSRYVLHRQLTVGYLIAFILFPLWIPLVRRLSSGKILFSLAIGGVVWGVLLQWWNSIDHEIDQSLAVINAVELIGVFSAAGAMYWVMKRIGVGWALIATGMGMMLFVDRSSGLFADGPWRYGYALPTAILVFGLAVVIGRKRFEFVLVLILTVAAIASGSRSVFGILLLTAVMLMIGWARHKNLRRPSSALLTACIIAVLAVAVLNLGQALLLEGYLGESAQQRTEIQVDTSGSVLMGGRPELGATIALIGSQPWGMGLGVMPNWTDIQLGRWGMSQLGYDPNNGYVDNYMFGQGFRLHSVFGDLWANYGIPGLVIVIFLFWMCIKILSLGSARIGDAPMYYVTFQTMWNMLFAPWYSSILMLILFLALAWHRLEETNPSRELIGVTPR